MITVKHEKTKDWFICDFGNIIPKSDIVSMEHPFYTLSTKPDTKIRRYEHNGNRLTITPSILGLATIHDKDVLIYCISQLMSGINKGKIPNRVVRFKAYDLLITTNRPRGGESYKRLEKAFSRLTGTLLETNIKTNGKKINEKFHILEHVKTIYSSPESKRMVELEVTLSEWLYNSVLGKEVLSINPDYFKIRKPIERRIYEIARKHCGQQEQWIIGIKNLHKKVGSAATFGKFKFMLNHVIKHNDLPDYSLGLQGNNVIFFHHIKPIAPSEIQAESCGFYLKPQTIENAKKIVGQQYDIYALKQEWKDWWKSSGEPELKSPDGAFINFCKKRVGH